MAMNPYELVNNVQTLVSFPDIYLKLSALIDDPNSSMSDIGRIIEKDPALAARVLKVVNSPFYGFTSRIDTISRAVSVIGTKQLRDLVLATSAAKTFKGLENSVVTMENFWKHSLYCAIAAKVLGGHCMRSKNESLFITGLLHDIGQLVMFFRMPDTTKKILTRVQDSVREIDMSQAEQEILGFDHAKVGGELLRVWRLPENIHKAVEFHHAPDQAGDYQMEASIIHIANHIASLVELGVRDSDSGSILKQSALDVTGVTAEVIDDTISEVIKEFDNMKFLLAE